MICSFVALLFSLLDFGCFSIVVYMTQTMKSSMVKIQPCTRVDTVISPMDYGTIFHIKNFFRQGLVIIRIEDTENIIDFLDGDNKRLHTRIIKPTEVDARCPGL